MVGLFLFNFLKSFSIPNRIQVRFKAEFEIKGLLGHSGNGSVCRATNKLDKKDYAIEMAQYEGEIDPKVLREIIMSSELNHVNIVRYFSSWK